MPSTTHILTVLQACDNWRTGERLHLPDKDTISIKDLTALLKECWPGSPNAWERERLMQKCREVNAT